MLEFHYVLCDTKSFMEVLVVRIWNGYGHKPIIIISWKSLRARMRMTPITQRGPKKDVCDFQVTQPYCIPGRPQDSNLF